MSSFLNGSMTRCIAIPGAMLFVAVSAAQNVSHGWELGAARSEFAAYVLAAASLAGALIQPAAFFAALSSFRQWAIGRGLVASLVGLVCLGYALLSSLGFTATSADASAATRGAGADAYVIAKGQADAALSELKALADVRGSKAAKRRGELEATLQKAQASMAAPHTATAANPAASALSVYAAAAGYTVKADAIAPWLVLFGVLFVEVGASFALIVVAGLPCAAPAAAQPIEASAPAPLADKQSADVRAPVPGTGGQLRRGRPRAKSLEAIKEQIANDGGAAEGSFQALGDRWGLSKASARRAVHALAAAGAVTLAATGSGTLVRLA